MKKEKIQKSPIFSFVVYHKNITHFCGIPQKFKNGIKKNFLKQNKNKKQENLTSYKNISFIGGKI